MIIRMHRIFNLFRREFWRNNLVLCVSFLIVPLLTLILLDAFHILYVSIIVGLNFVGLIFQLADYPKQAQLRDGVLTYTENYEVSKGERRRLHFRITEIRQVELVQNRLEKRMNVGRIRFRGTADVEPALAVKERKIVFFELCGITDFERVSQLFQNQ